MVGPYGATREPKHLVNKNHGRDSSVFWLRDGCKTQGVHSPGAQRACGLRLSLALASSLCLWEKPTVPGGLPRILPSRVVSAQVPGHRSWAEHCRHRDPLSAKHSVLGKSQWVSWRAALPHHPLFNAVQGDTAADLGDPHW